MELSHHKLFVREQICIRKKSTVYVIMALMAGNEAEIGQDVQRGLLMQFRRRLAHLNYDTIIKMARDLGSGIALTDEFKSNCSAIFLRIANRISSSKKDSEDNSPIEVRSSRWKDLLGPERVNDATRPNRELIHGQLGGPLYQLLSCLPGHS